MVRVTVLLGTVIRVPVSVTVAQFMCWAEMCLGMEIVEKVVEFEGEGAEMVICSEAEEAVSGGKKGALSWESGEAFCRGTMGCSYKCSLIGRNSVNGAMGMGVDIPLIPLLDLMLLLEFLSE